MRILTVTAAIAVVAAAGGAQAQDRSSNPITPMNAAHIFILRYDGKVRWGASGYDRLGTDPSVEPSWKGQPYRELTIKLTVEEELKGRLLQHVGVSFEDKIREYTGRSKHTPIWETSELVRPGGWGPGTRVLAWCDGSSNDARELLVRDHCGDLRPDVETLADTRVIVDLERAKAPLSAVLQIARAQVATRGSVFAQYVGARVGWVFPVADVSRVADETVAALIDLAASPEIGWGARSTYAGLVADILGSSPTPRPAIEMRWIRTLFRLLVSPPVAITEGVRDNLARPFLVNALGIDLIPQPLGKSGTRPRPYHTADEVFSGTAAERAVAVAWVRNHPEAQWKQPLLDWLTKSAGK